MNNLWSYGDVADLQPLQDSSDEEDNKAVFDDLSCLPQHKRRKLELLGRSYKQVELIDLDNEENIRKKPAKQNKKATKCAPKTDSDSDLDLDYAPVITRTREALSLDPIILQNQNLMRQFQQAAQEPELDEPELELASQPAAREATSHAQPAARRSSGNDSDSDSNTSTDAPAVEDAKVILKLQCSRGTFKLRTKMQNPMQSLFEAFKTQAKQKGWLSDQDAPKVRFIFDGDSLSENDTAEGLDMEGDEIIEVRW